MKTELERARAQFEYEREHRGRILSAAKGDARSRAFNEAYDGLYAGMASGDFLDQETEPQRKATQKLKLLRRFFRPDSRVAEFGPGNFHLARAVAPMVASLTLIDVAEPDASVQLPENCTFYKGDGISLPQDLPRSGFDLIWSAHVVEHIHPEDVHEHLVNVRAALNDGGSYIIFTPNRFSGPHDISKRFSDVAQGLHLKEYTVSEMRNALQKAGFKKIDAFAGGKGVYLHVPLWLPLLTEWKLHFLPTSIRRRIASLLPIKAILGIVIVGTKS